MWSLLTEDGANIAFVEGDYGIVLPIEVSGIEISSDDSVKLTVLTEKNGTEKFNKDFTNIENNVVPISLTSEESSSLSAGKYVYNLDWYKDGTFQCNIVNGAILKVVDKA